MFKIHIGLKLAKFSSLLSIMPLFFALLAESLLLFPDFLGSLRVRNLDYSYDIVFSVIGFLYTHPGFDISMLITVVKAIINFGVS